MLIFSNAVQLMTIVVEASVAHHLTIVAEVKIIADKVKINKYDKKNSVNFLMEICHQRSKNNSLSYFWYSFMEFGHDKIEMYYLNDNDKQVIP